MTNSMDDFDIDGTPKRALTAATIGFFFGAAAVALLSPAATRFQSAMDLSTTQTGFLVSAPVLLGSLLRIPFGAWCDKNGGRKPFLILLGLSIIGMAGFTTLLVLYYPDGMDASLYPAFFGFAALSGCGIGVFSVGVSQTSFWYPNDEQGFALGVYGGVGNIAPGIFTFLIPILFATFGFTGSYIAWFGLLLVGAAAYYVLSADAWYFQLQRQGLDTETARERAREAGQEIFPEGTPLEGLIKSAKIWKTWALVGGYFFTFGGFLAMVTWLPTYYQQYLGVGAQTAGGLVGVFTIFGSLIRVPAGSVADNIGGEETAAISMGIVLAGSVLLAFIQSVPLAFFGTLVVGAGMGINNAALFQKVPEEIPEAVSGASGWIGGLGAFGGFVIPPILGQLVTVMGPVGYARGFLLYGLLAVIGLGSVYTLYRSDSRVETEESQPVGS